LTIAIFLVQVLSRGVLQLLTDDVCRSCDMCKCSGLVNKIWAGSFM